MEDIKVIAKNNRFTNYFRDAYHELTKVTWPTQKQAVRLTAIVLGFVALFAVFLAGVDFISNYGYTYLLGLIK